jgi:hypothetical protein
MKKTYILFYRAFKYNLKREMIIEVEFHEIEIAIFHEI